MLRIAKKGEVKPTATTNEFKPEKEQQLKIRNILASGQELNFSEIQQIYQWTPSVNAEILAHLIHDAVAQATQHNYQHTADFVLYLYALPHDQTELRHFLKQKFKVDSILLLLVLLERKDNPLTLKLVSTILDAYTLNLMLNGKQVIQLWKAEISQLRNQYECLQEVQSMLKSLEKQQVRGKGSGLRKVVIPL